jgi:hypothetical protein
MGYKIEHLTPTAIDQSITTLINYPVDITLAGSDPD